MKIKAIYQTLLALMFSTVVSVSAVSAVEVKTLSKDEVEQAFFGNTMDYAKAYVFWGSNGVLKGKSKRGPTDTGKYWIKDDGIYCRKWNKWRGGSEECVKIKRAGDDFASVRLDGTVRGTFKILKGNAKGLAAPRMWSTTVANDQVIATDCTECGDDIRFIGMLIECKGEDKPALVTVHQAAVENGEEGAVLPIQFKVDRQVFNYQAATRYYSQIGYTPELKLQPGAPLLAALSAGNKFIVTYADANTKISLRGSGKSLESFSSHCGWAN